MWCDKRRMEKEQRTREVSKRRTVREYGIRDLLLLIRGPDVPYQTSDVRVYFLRLRRLRGFLSSLRSRRVVSSRVILLDATSRTNCSQSLIGNFLFGGRPFSSKNTRHAARAVRLLPSRNG